MVAPGHQPVCLSSVVRLLLPTAYIQQQGPAQGVTIRNCNFRSVGRSGWAIATEYYLAESVAVNRTKPFYQSVTIEDCTFDVSHSLVDCHPSVVLDGLVFGFFGRSALTHTHTLTRTHTHTHAQDSVFDRAAIIGFGVDGIPPAEDWPSNRVTLRRSVFAGNKNDGAAGTADFLGLLSFDAFVEVVVEDVCFDDNETPSGSFMEIKNTDSTVTGIYGGDTSVFSGNVTVESCVDGTLLATVDETVCETADGTFEQCPLTMTNAPTTAPNVGSTPGPTVEPIDDPSTAFSLWGMMTGFWAFTALSTVAAIWILL